MGRAGERTTKWQKSQGVSANIVVQYVLGFVEINLLFKLKYAILNQITN